MENPFPGMNPFIEGYKWPPFHVNMIIKMQDALISQLPEGYFIEPETTLYVEETEVEFRPDISIVEDATTPYGSTGGAAVLTPPTKRKVIEEIKVRSLHVIDAKSKRLVTSVKLLSPTNKKGDGLRTYRQKRQHLITEGVNLVEIDLLRGGQRADKRTKSTSPYLIQVFNASNREILEWSVGLLDSLPTVPVPLLYSHAPLVLDLQAAFNTTFRFSSLPNLLSYNLTELKPRIEDPTELAALENYLEEAS